MVGKQVFFLQEYPETAFDNALKHTEEGYIEFNVSEIHKNNICRLMITIEDSGVGISADKLDELPEHRINTIRGSRLGGFR